jgi:hypothetical protein
MAKIKSTLDLVMERTRNLSLTEEEREALRRKESIDKVRGWVQKLIDHKMTMAELGSSLRADAAAYPGLRDILKEELMSHIDPDKENDLIFQALEEALELDTTPFRESIMAYHNRSDLHRHEHLERLSSELRKRGIYGEAVIPNLEHDEAWIASSKKLKEEFKDQLKTLRGI